MKKLFISLFVGIISISFTPSLHAQLFEDFESGSKASYAGASVSLSSGSWYLNDALIGNLSGDKYNGSQGVRMDRRNGKTGNIFMQFDKASGADEVSFYLANYGNSTGNTLQLQYSTDQGSSWTNIGDEISAPTSLTQVSVPVEIDGNIRFKFVHASGTDRLNLDDIRITDYVTPEDSATIDVFVNDIQYAVSDTLQFAPTSLSSTRTATISIRNRGNTSLNIQNIDLSGAGYSVSALNDSVLAFGESTELTLSFSPVSEGIFEGNLLIQSNAVNVSEWPIGLFGEGFSESDAITIAEARQLPFGTRVTIGGRVTVANQFQGPVFLEDGTAGLAVFWDALHSAVQIGDSVVVTGPLTEFNPIGGADGDFLMQIGVHNGDSDITFSVIDVPKREVEPTLVTVAGMNSGNYEAQLVLIQNATIAHSGAFDTNDINYGLSDGTGQAFIRIDGSTNIGGAEAPSGPVNIVGVVDQFDGNYQLKPRFTDDLGVEAISYPGENITMDQTFEAVTWNIEWFGDTGNGPENEAEQLNKAIEVIRTIDADLYAFQEISDAAQFYTMLDSLEGYGGFMANFSQSQKTAYLFKRATVDSLNSGLISENMNPSNWANGRLPLMFHFNATVGEEVREIYAFNIHAKAFSDLDSYNQRKEASAELKLYLDNQHRDDNVLFLGDYNDETMTSITTGQESPYKNFADDTEYTILTSLLEEKGLSSQSSNSFIDHITITSELTDEFFEGTQRVENTSYIGSYLSTTSDHYPIWGRFSFVPVDSLVVTSIEDMELPAAISLHQNYPNPFNPSTVISYRLKESSVVTLEVYDLMGRKVATLVKGPQAAGAQSVRFDASGLSSGIYIYRLKVNGGMQLSRKMMLIK